MEEGYKLCPFCANEIKEKAIKCQYCGEFLEKDEKQEEKKLKPCPYCSNEIDIIANICPFCGENLSNNPKDFKNEVKEKSYSENGDIEMKEQEGKDEKKISPEEKALKKANNRIDSALGLGAFSIVMTVIGLVKNFENGSSNIFSLLDIIYYIILLFFLYKKNRMAALFFLIDYIISSIAFAIQGYKFTSARFVIIFFLFLGTIGCFRYHSLTNQKKLSTSEIVILIIGLMYTFLSMASLMLL